MSSVSAPFAGFLPTMPMHSPVAALRSLPRTVLFDGPPDPIQDGFAPGTVPEPELGACEEPVPSAVPPSPSEFEPAAHSTSGIRRISDR
ncbi:hypothetical protein [Streptomyces sp. NBC_00996]|uniref:hypothetical protein n=1 Tax=Streptomyces sp. NBC_00996 TaxID=2903710 RepID=UPI00386ABF43|nr:hypothetical protein OG390_45940 [Streptomyces sp. NBC_00996]